MLYGLLMMRNLERIVRMYKEQKRAIAQEKAQKLEQDILNKKDGNELDYLDKEGITVGRRFVFIHEGNSVIAVPRGDAWLEEEQ